MVSIATDLQAVVALRRFSAMLENSAIEIHADTTAIDPASMDGVYTFFGRIGKQRVAVITTLFKIYGGSFSKKNSRRVCEFIDLAARENVPIIFSLDSLGARFTEGRTVFNDSFSILTQLAYFRKSNLLITLGSGHVLGLAALIFAQGHYRVANRHDTEFNLTGPEVHRVFFGKSDTNFSDYSSAEHQFSSNTLVHELVDGRDNMFRLAGQMIDLFFNSSPTPRRLIRDEQPESEIGALLLKSKDQLTALKDELGQEMTELFGQKGMMQRAYVGRLDGKRIGYWVNPPSHPNNLLSAKAVEKATAALELFKVLKLPVVCVLDSPGGDPRKAESDQDMVMKMIRLVHMMIDYPYKKMGLINGRCFGGAAMFCFPKFFGGLPTFAVAGSKIGVMSHEIVNMLLKEGGRLREEWEAAAKSERADLSDIIAARTIDGVIAPDQIRQTILETLYTPAFSAQQLSPQLEGLALQQRLP